MVRQITSGPRDSAFEEEGAGAVLVDVAVLFELLNRFLITPSCLILLEVFRGLSFDGSYFSPLEGGDVDGDVL